MIDKELVLHYSFTLLQFSCTLPQLTSMLVEWDKYVYCIYYCEFLRYCGTTFLSQ
uniref:Uncharacterized protein n=1 Tax=Arundo donax TaxID=35708 RepID=A0A0A8YSJ8_ARUDO